MTETSVDAHVLIYMAVLRNELTVSKRNENKRHVEIICY